MSPSGDPIEEMTTLQVLIVTNKELGSKSQLTGKDRLVAPLSAKPGSSDDKVRHLLYRLMKSGVPRPHVTCFLCLQGRLKSHSRAPLDKVQKGEAIQVQASAARGEMVEILGKLSPIAPTPRSSRPNRTALASDVQMRRRRAAVEATSAEEATSEKRKKKQR